LLTIASIKRLAVLLTVTLVEQNTGITMGYLLIRLSTIVSIDAIFSGADSVQLVHKYCTNLFELLSRVK